MKKVWIKDTHLGLKRVIFLETIGFIFLSFSYTNNENIFWFLFGIIIILNFWLIYLTRQNGVIVSLESFFVFKKKLNVIDYYDYKKKGIKRLIGNFETKNFQSSIFIKSNSKKWAYLDSIRILIKELKLKHNKILILGGGGMALPITISKTFNKTQVEVVEISPTMIRIAQKYFLGKFSNKISLIKNDAFDFIKKTSKKYDLIIVDIVNGTNLPKKISSINFLQKLKSQGKTIIINFGIAKDEKDSQLNVILNKYEKNWKQSAVYLVNGNFFGIFGTNVKRGKIPFQRIY